MAKQFECFYGESGSGKSTGAAEVVKDIYQETGRTFRVAVGDGSAATYQDAGLVDVGAVELCDFSIRDWPLSTLQQLSEGWWPVDVEDPKSPMKPMTPEQFAKLGGYIFEGLSVGSAYIMGNKKGGLAYRGARGEKIGQDSPIRIVDVDVDSKGIPMPNTGTGLQFGGNPMAHYNVAQATMRGVLQSSKGLPGFVIWTAHEKTVEDKQSGDKVIGPEGPGQAMTASLTKDFNNTIHFVLAGKKSGKKPDQFTGKQVEQLGIERRIYTRDHFDPDGLVFVRYKAVTRIAAEHSDKMPEYLTDEPGKPGSAIRKYYEIIADARRAVAEKLRKG